MQQETEHDSRGFQNRTTKFEPKRLRWCPQDKPSPDPLLIPRLLFSSRVSFPFSPPRVPFFFHWRLLSRSPFVPLLVSLFVPRVLPFVSLSYPSHRTPRITPFLLCVPSFPRVTFRLPTSSHQWILLLSIRQFCASARKQFVAATKAGCLLPLQQCDVERLCGRAKNPHAFQEK